MQTASSAVQRLKHAVLETRSAVEKPVALATREQLRETARLAQEALDLKGTPRHVLMELAVSHRASGEGAPTVWPSNAYLAHKIGVSERSVSKAVTTLIEQGLIIRRDSANQKRFRRVGADGREIVYGFDMSPLLKRRSEFESAVAAINAAKLEQKRLRAVIGGDRRRAKNALEWLALHSQTNTDDIAARFGDLTRRTPTRAPKDGLKQSLADQWALLADDAEQRLALIDVTEFKLVETPGAIEVFASDSSTNDGRNFQHKEPESDLSIENCSEKEVPPASPPEKRSDDEIDLKLVLEACPAAGDYPEPIRSTYDLVAAGSYLRASTTAAPDVWSKGVSSIGASLTAVAIIYAYQRINDDVACGANRIRSHGGFTQSILTGVATGKINLRAELSSLRRKHLQ